MININNTSWEDLTSADIEEFLDGDAEESFFFEFKCDDVTPPKLIKEISALSNTYGGYIFIGVKDDKTLSGCKKWTEERINTTIHDSLTPVPQFDVKKFIINEEVVLIMKIEEGNMPPYITNSGLIYERISSSSSPIKDSSKLTQLYQKRADQTEKIRKKIELPAVHIDNTLPGNLCGYIDFGFSMTLSETSYLQKHFYDYDLTNVCELIDESEDFYHISRVGYSYVIRAGECTPSQKNAENVTRIGNGIQNFMEIMCDGSVRGRALITGSTDNTGADIAPVFMIHTFEQFYRLFLNNDLPQKFISAQKYQKLTVLKQFKANLESTIELGDDNLQKFYHNQVDKFGEPLIIEGNRIPTTDFDVIDRRVIERFWGDFNLDNLIDSLFDNAYEFLGFLSQEEVK